MKKGAWANIPPKSNRNARASARTAEPDGVLHAYIALEPFRQEWIAAIDFSDVPAAAARIVAEFDGWAPALDRADHRRRYATGPAHDPHTAERPSLGAV